MSITNLFAKLISLVSLTVKLPSIVVLPDVVNVFIDVFPLTFKFLATVKYSFNETSPFTSNRDCNVVALDTFNVDSKVVTLATFKVFPNVVALLTDNVCLNSVTPVDVSVDVCNPPFAVSLPVNVLVLATSN